MDSKPFDFKKLDALLVAAKDILGFPVTCIIRPREDGASTIMLSWSYVRITIEMSVRDLARLSPGDASRLKQHTELNKTS